MSDITFEADVVKYLRKKSESGYGSQVFISPDQRYVGAIRNSSLNNLEEQMLLGTDCLTSSWIDNDHIHVRKEFCIQEDEKDSPNKTSSYIIETEFYNVKEAFDSHESYYIDKKLLPSQVDIDDTALVIDSLRYDANSESYNNNYTIVRVDTLTFVNKANVEIKVAEKITYKKSSTDGKFYTKEVFTNYLKAEVEKEKNNLANKEEGGTVNE